MPDIFVSNTKASLGPCRVIWDAGNTTDGEVVIDRTKGGCHFKTEFNTEDITFDQTGDAAADVLLTKVGAVFEVPMATADLEVIQRVTPNSTLYTDTVDTTKKAMEVVATAGVSLLPKARKVRLEPLNGTEEQHVTLFKAIAIPQTDANFGPKETQTVMVRFVGIPDPAVRNRSYCIGPEDVLPA